MEQINARLTYLQSIEPNWGGHNEKVPDAVAASAPKVFEVVRQVSEDLLSWSRDPTVDIGLDDDGGIEWQLWETYTPSKNRIFHDFSFTRNRIDYNRTKFIEKINLQDHSFPGAVLDYDDTVPEYMTLNVIPFVRHCMLPDKSEWQLL